MSQSKMGKKLITPKRIKEDSEQVVSFPEKNPHPVFQISRAKKILYANKAAESLLRAWKERLGRKFPKKLGLMIHKTFGSGANTRAEAMLGKRVFSFSIAQSCSSSHVNVYGMEITKQYPPNNPT